MSDAICDNNWDPRLFLAESKHHQSFPKLNRYCAPFVLTFIPTNTVL